MVESVTISISIFVDFPDPLDSFITCSVFWCNPDKNLKSFSKAHVNQTTFKTEDVVLQSPIFH